MACYGSGVRSLANARTVVGELFGIVDPGCLFERPIPLRHRLVFYIGHVEAFDRNLIGTAVPDVGTASAELDRLFAFGIDPGAGNVPADMPEDWPSMAAVEDYVARTRELVDDCWAAAPEQLRHVAIEHRLMHAETLAYMLHAMCPSKKSGPAEDVPPGDRRASDTVAVEAGPTVLGQDDPDAFGWDNEFASHTVRVDAFRMDRFKVTNADYLEFVETGGLPAPFWVQRSGEWRLRRMFDEVPLPLHWPVYVTQQQASAYADWRGGGLPTEAQWQRAAYPDARPFPWGEALPDARHGNFDFRRWDPEPVDAHPASASPFGVEGMLGNGWEWTSTKFRPFDGFKPFSFYRGYSADFFDDDHYVLKGGSPRTDAVFVRRSFRNWFRSDYPYVFATFRCIHNSH